MARVIAVLFFSMLPIAVAPKAIVVPSYTYSVTINPDDVYDGDTVTKADIDLGFRISTEQRLRLLGVDCPEIRPHNPDKNRSADDLNAERMAAIAARDYTRQWIRDHSNLVVETRRDKDATDSFDRWLSKLYGSKDGRQDCLNDDLLEQRHARKFRDK